jgi:hypothetical protein
MIAKALGAAVAVGLSIATLMPAAAQLAPCDAPLPTPVSGEIAHQFLIVGQIEDFTLDTSDTSELACATMRVHGVEVVLPRNLIVQMPARYLTPEQIFALKPASVTSGSGLALSDTPPPIAAFEATVAGNIVGDRYIAGLVWISQHSLASGSGFIRSISATGEITVVADASVGASTTQPVTRIRINDPEGRFAPPDGDADPRFKVDDENPTVHALTGYPMCIAHAGAPGECPANNRLRDGGGAPIRTYIVGDTPFPGSPAGAPEIPRCTTCNARFQAPLLVGDFITYSGTLARDPAGDIYVSAHTLEANVAIYTQPNTNPAYVSIEGSLIGTQGPLIPRAGAPGLTLPQETQDRLKIEGVSSDPVRRVELYAIDIDPATGDSKLRLFNTVPVQAAPLGRFRLILGSRANALYDSDGNEIGAARELMARVEGASNLDGQPVPDPLPADRVAHGLVPNQYVAPFGEFIFPENKLGGDPILPANFECLPFLVLGSGPLEGTGQLVERLDPWPGYAPAPTAVACGPRPKI